MTVYISMLCFHSTLVAQSYNVDWGIEDLEQREVFIKVDLSWVINYMIYRNQMVFFRF